MRKFRKQTFLLYTDKAHLFTNDHLGNQGFCQAMGQAPSILAAQARTNESIIIAMTATATKADETTISKLSDMTNPKVIRYSPVTENHMFYKILRPPSNYGFRGEYESPSTLKLIKILVLDRFISCIKINEDSKIIMIFFQIFEESA